MLRGPKNIRKIRNKFVSVCGYTAKLDKQIIIGKCLFLLLSTLSPPTCVVDLVSSIQSFFLGFLYFFQTPYFTSNQILPFGFAEQTTQQKVI